MAASSRKTAARVSATKERKAFEGEDGNAILAIEAVDDTLGGIQTTLDDILAASADATGVRDSFGRARVSEPVTLFDSKQIFDNQPLFWDDQEVSGGSTTSTHSVDRASSTLLVAATTAGRRVRQTFQRFNYQPGKSLLVLVTGVLDASGGGTGISSAMGYYDDENGIFFKYDEGTMKIVKRSFVTGSAVDTEVSQASWNGDVMDGTGASGVTLDLSQAQIGWMDMEWLGVGSIRVGFIVDGAFILCHSFHHANSINSVYMSLANLPMRYEIENDGTGVVSEMEAICCTVISEAGVERNGMLRYGSTAGTLVNANSTSAVYACFGIRLKASALAETIDLVNATMVSTQNDDFEALLYWNPTVAGTFTYVDQTNSAVQTAIGAGANPSPNTVTGGTLIGGGISKVDTPILAQMDNALRLGSAIDGTPDEIVLCVRPLTTNADIEAGLGWRELA